MKKHNLSTLLHLLELFVAAAIAILVAWALKGLFLIEVNDMLIGVIAIILGGVAKYVRVAPGTGVPDYVNPSSKQE